MGRKLPFTIDRFRPLAALGVGQLTPKSGRSNAPPIPQIVEPYPNIEAPFRDSNQLKSSPRGVINCRQAGAFAQIGNRKPAAFLSGTMNPRLYRARVMATYILF